MMVYGGGDERVKIISTEQKRTRFCLSEDNILKLSSGNDY
jgi:hypothetical protein